MLHANNSLINIKFASSVPTKQKGLKVSFTDSGLSNPLAYPLILVAIAMAAIQEERRSGTDKDTHTVLTLGSGSQWGLAELEYFRVRFERDKFDPLPDIVLRFTPKDVSESGTNFVQDEKMGTTDLPLSATEDGRKHRPKIADSRYHRVAH
jgi:hypothetical protein